MPQAAEEQLAGAAAVALAVEAEGQVADVQVDGQGDDGEGPGGDVQHRGQGGEADEAQAVAQGHPLAHAGVGDGHHSVAAAGVVLPQVPAERVEVRELPAVQETTHQQSTWGGRGRERMREGNLRAYNAFSMPIRAGNKWFMFGSVRKLSFESNNCNNSFSRI